MDDAEKCVMRDELIALFRSWARDGADLKSIAEVVYATVNTNPPMRAEFNAVAIVALLSAGCRVEFEEAEQA